jgi:predicted nucleic acid-binding protein
LVEAAIDTRIELVLPEVVLDELAGVLQAKLGFSEQRCREINRFLVELASERVPVPQRVQHVTGDPADNAILACALAATVDVAATGDRKHLLPLVRHGATRLMTPQALLAELRAQMTKRADTNSWAPRLR